MVEQQIEVVVLAPDLERILAAYECEALPQFKDQRSEMVQKTALKLALRDVWTEGQKIEAVGVLDQFLGEL